MDPYEIIQPGSFDPVNHWYAKALNATIHPMVDFFLHLSKDRIVERYCHLRPKVNKEYLSKILSHKPRYFRWGGADLINVTTESGKRQMVVIENNSCPSGQKSMPLQNDHDEFGSYRKLIEKTFLPMMKGQRMIEGAMAVLYDKNPMEASGYAATIAEFLNEPVYYIYFPTEGYEEYLKFDEGVLKLKIESGEWISIRAAFRYVTQKPWSRIPIHTKTKILNPVLACISGGRNKMVAAKAYDLFNTELEANGLKIQMPETIWDLSKNEVPIWVKKMGGQAVIKVPYSNAGQGVFTIVNEAELAAFMVLDFEYDQFIVQSLIGNYGWSSLTSKGKFYHVGTIPSDKKNTFVTDIRMMVHSTSQGILPLCVYSRRARSPLLNTIEGSTDSWAMLGTNLSIKNDQGGWGSDTNRLMLMDRRDFNKLGIGVDDLIEAYIQSVLSMIAIDNMAQTFVNSKGRFRPKLFQSLNNDQSLINEILLE